MASQVTAKGGFGSSNYRSYALGVLLIIYVFEVIDRILLSLVQERVRVEMSLSDFQLGLLGGPAFVVLYVLSTVPIARHSEDKNRITIVATGAAIWSAATAACGLAGGFTQLLVARMFVGIGEAACVPVSHSAISDYFPSHKRASALAIFGLAIPIGILLAAFGGGWLAQNFDWRTMFKMLGGLGILAALLLKLTVKDPGRSSEHDQMPGFITALKSIGSKRSFRHAIADFYSAHLAAQAGVTLQLCADHPATTGCAEISGAGLRAGLLVALMFALWGAVHFWLVGRTYGQDRFDKSA